MPLTYDQTEELADQVERADANDWREYERRKRAWLLTHPEANAHEVFDACRAIAEELSL